MPSGYQMQGISKIHAVFYMVQSFDQTVQTFNRYGGQSREGAQSTAYIGSRISVDAAQNPIGFQNNSSADKDIALCNYLAGGCRL